MSKWYGLWDTKDHCWLGDDNGPAGFKDLALARVAAQVAEDMMLGTDLAGRVQARELPSRRFRLRDEVPAKHTALESLQRIEGSGPYWGNKEKQ